MAAVATAAFCAPALAQDNTKLRVMGMPLATGKIQKDKEQPFFENFSKGKLRVAVDKLTDDIWKYSEELWADGMYPGFAAWFGRLPGGLLHTNIGCCALFATTSGSSVATAATIGTVALPSLRRHGYNMPDRS